MTERDVTPIPKPEPRVKAPSTWGRKRKRIKPMSDKKREEDPRTPIFQRDGGQCRLAPFLPDMECDGDLDVLPLEAEPVTACAVHGAWVSANPKAAAAIGLKP